MIGVMIATALLIFSSFVIGFYIGSFQDNSLGGKVLSAVRNKYDKQKVGGILKPPAEVLANRGTVLEKTEQAMEELLDTEIGGGDNAS